NSLISIGKIVKSFGINGHLLVNSEFLDDYNFNKRIAIFVYWEYCFVPLIIEDLENRGDNYYLVKFELIDNVDDASKITGCNIYAFKDDIEIEKIDYLSSPERFVGFDVIDISYGLLGKVIGILRGASPQLEVSSHEDSLFIQLIPEYMDHVDWDNEIIFVNLPEQLFSFYGLK